MQVIRSGYLNNKFYLLALLLFAIFIGILVQHLYLQHEKNLEQLSLVEVKQIIAELQLQVQQPHVSDTKQLLGPLGGRSEIEVLVTKNKEKWPVRQKGLYDQKRQTRNIFSDGSIINAWFSYQRQQQAATDDFPASGFIFLSYDLSAIKSGIWNQVISDCKPLFAAALAFILSLILLLRHITTKHLRPGESHHQHQIGLQDASSNDFKQEDLSDLTQAFSTVKGELLNYSEEDSDSRELQAAKQKLALIEQRYRVLIDFAPEALFILDLEKLKFIDCNGKAEAMTGVQRAELLKVGPLELSPEKQLDGQLSADFLLLQIDKVRSAGQATFEWLYFNAAGEQTPCEVRMVRLPSTTNKLIVRGSFIDISERKAAENALRESQENLSVTLNSIGDAVIVTDQNQIIIRMNPVAEQLTGWLYEQAKGLHVDEILHFIDAKSRLPQPSLAEKVIRKQTILGLSNDTVLLTRTGEEKHISNSAAPIVNANNELIGVIIVFQDVTETYNIQKSLRESNDRFSAFSTAMPDFGCILDEDGYYVEVYGTNKLFYQKPKQMLGKNIQDLLPAGPAQTALQTINKTLSSGETQKVDYQLEVLAGLRHFEGRTAVMRTEPGEKRKIVLISRDITAKKRIEQELLEREKRFRELFEQLPNIALQGYSSDRKIMYWNKASERLYGYTQQEAVGKKLDDLIIPEIIKDATKSAIYDFVEKDIPIPAQELELCHKDGSQVPVFSSHIKLNNIRGQAELYCIDIDLSENKKAQAKIEQLAYYDALTELPNRRLFLDRLNQELIVEKRHQTFGAVLYLDLDNFKTLNDALGHIVGDILLCQVGRRMSQLLREEDTVARIGGDEFVVLLKELGAEQNSAAKKAQQIAEKIRTELCRPYQLESHEHVVTPSIGINMFPVNMETTPEIILKHADTAMYRAKKNGRNSISFYHPSMQVAADQRLKMEKDLRHALLHNEFQLYFQVQVDKTGLIIGAEALLRWIHPEKGMIIPAEFITVAEETGLIIPIGDWVTKSACEYLEKWQRHGLNKEFHLAINVSPKQFHRNDFVEKTINILTASGIATNQLTLELTESIVIDNIETTIDKMQTLKNKGVRFSIDDFGTGYSSLAYLKQLPIDQLKIDRSFIRDINKDPNNEVIVETIISMANLLGLQAIAEGVENEQQRDFLYAKGCSAYQGNSFSQPVPEHVFLNLIGL